MRDRLIFVGEIATPYNRIEDCPRNITPDGPPCTVTIYKEFVKECFGLVKGRQIIILYWLDSEDKKDAKRPGDVPQQMGAFSIRTPHRPNPVGVAVTEIKEVDVKGGTILVYGLDCLNGTKVIDIKPAILEERVAQR